MSFFYSENENDIKTFVKSTMEEEEVPSDDEANDRDFLKKKPWKRRKVLTTIPLKPKFCPF